MTVHQASEPRDVSRGTSTVGPGAGERRCLLEANFVRAVPERGRFRVLPIFVVGGVALLTGASAALGVATSPRPAATPQPRRSAFLLIPTTTSAPTTTVPPTATSQPTTATSQPTTATSQPTTTSSRPAPPLGGTSTSGNLLPGQSFTPTPLPTIPCPTGEPSVSNLTWSSQPAGTDPWGETQYATTVSGTVHNGVDQAIENVVVSVQMQMAGNGGTGQGTVNVDGGGSIPAWADEPFSATLPWLALTPTQYASGQISIWRPVLLGNWPAGCTPGQPALH
jgi:hypothetical protein